jgi:hypothetical protein
MNPAAAQNQLGRIYGKVTTVNGDVMEGRISWSDHETIWYHTFDGYYDFFDHNRDAYARQREYLGKRPKSTSSEFMVYFGDIASIKRRGSRCVVLLKDGREYEVTEGDVGETLSINEVDYGKMDVSWRSLEEVEFMDEPESFRTSSNENAYPIYGKVYTRDDVVFEGFIMWDNDETLSTHILDAKEGRKNREIPFSKIKSIRSRSRNSCEIVLMTGKEIIVTGSNDVNSDNNGLIVTDINIGRVDINWSDVEKVDFEHQVNEGSYSDFKPGKPLFGTVTDEDGEEHVGFIRWDDDESVTTDFLNGEAYSMKMTIRFTNIKEIQHRTRKSAVVILKNGEKMLMRGSNDVDSGNRGIVILDKADDKEGIILSWDEFEKVVFK